jgi:GxxExxY protein
MGNLFQKCQFLERWCRIEGTDQFCPCVSLKRLFTSLTYLNFCKHNSSFATLVRCKRILMHPLYQKADKLSGEAIGSAIEVHRIKGPGLLESIYERCMLRECELRKIAAVNQRLVKIEYKGLVFEEPLRFDVLLEDCLLLELKCVQTILPVHKAQLLSYMKLLDVPSGSSSIFTSSNSSTVSHG